MKVVKFPHSLGNSKKIMILGSFLSFHDGHMLLLKEAQKYKRKVIVLLMDNLSILKNKTKHPFISLDVRLQQLANIDVDEVVVLDFNNTIMSMDGKEFAKELKATYNVEKFVVGKDFAMGKNASYTSTDLSKDFETKIVNPLKINDKKLSTALFREFIEFGDVHLIKKYSPFYYTIRTRVKSDKTFEFDGLTPHTGIYAAWAIVNDVRYWAIVRISLTKKHEIIVPELLVKNTGYDVEIKFVKRNRAIIRKEFDEIKEKDHKEVLKYLQNHL